MLMQLIRKKYGKIDPVSKRKIKSDPIGVMIADVRADETVTVAWAKCHMKLDRFDKNKGIDIAQGRINLGSGILIPHSIRPQLADFVARTQKYYRTDNVVVVGKTHINQSCAEQDSKSFLDCVINECLKK